MTTNPQDTYLRQANAAARAAGHIFPTTQPAKPHWQRAAKRQLSPACARIRRRSV
jgi:hypothetical protein